MNFQGMSHRLSLVALCGAALVLSAIPYVHVPFTWFETLFHENSHALVAALTGGHVDRIALHMDGSGVTWSAGGWRPLVSFAGYAGAILWGAGLYALASGVSDRTARATVIVALCVGVLESMTWLAFSPASWFIMAILLIIMAALLWRPVAKIARHILRFIGIYVLLSGIRSPTWILAGAGNGSSDADTLKHMLWIPVTVWVGLWVAMGATALFLLYRRAARQDRSLRV